MKNNIIFLDIDGVLNSDHHHSILIGKYWGIDPYHVDILKTILEAIPDVKIVLTSTWREHREYKQVFLDVLKENKLDQYYLDDTIIIPRKFSEYTHVKRNDEILQWLEEHTVDNYVIVDDYYGIYLDNFIEIDPITGLDIEYIPKIVSIFERL